MKKYFPFKIKWLIIIASVCFLTLFIAILSIRDFSLINLALSIAVSGGATSIIVLVLLFYLKSRSLIIDSEKIIFHRGTIINGKTVFQKAVISLDEITSIKSKLHKGEALSKDTYFHTLKLTNGSEITFTLYEYGEKAEKEVIELIRNRIDLSKLL